MEQKPLSEMFVSMFKAMVGKQITVEMKNGLSYSGTLASVDHNLDLQLNDVTAIAQDKTISTMQQCYIKGSSVRYIELQSSDVDEQVLHSATREAVQTEQLARARAVARAESRVLAQAPARILLFHRLLRLGINVAIWAGLGLGLWLEHSHERNKPDS